MLNSFEELCIMRAVAVNSFAGVLNPHGAHIYIYIHILTEESIEKGPQWPSPCVFFDSDVFKMLHVDKSVHALLFKKIYLLAKKC